MSLPSVKPAQLSIRSFFQSKTPQYAPPPSSKLMSTTSSSSSSAKSSPPPPPPPAQTIATPAEPRDAADTSDFTIPPLPASLPSEASIRPVLPSDLNALRRINALLLPVSYPDSFYQRAVDIAASGRFSRVITWAHDGAEPKVVGGVVCRIEPVLDSNVKGQVPQNLYIQSLCILSPYRSLGLVNAAVDNIIATAISQPDLNVTAVTAHVWTENEDGLKWYKGRGFTYNDEPVRGYYLKLRPDSAWLVTRPVSASVRSSLPSSSPPGPPRAVPSSTTAAVVNLPPMSGPPKNLASGRPTLATAKSYQNQRPGTEWNDLPDDMSGGLLAPRRNAEISSAPGSRSSSVAAKKKKDRSYPAAAFAG